MGTDKEILTGCTGWEQDKDGDTGEGLTTKIAKIAEKHGKRRNF
jgi:hypothetical protein